MDRRMHVLFLPRWYPDRNDPMPGLFIQQLAESLSPGISVAVLYPVADPHAAGQIEADRRNEKGVEVIRVYYRPCSWNIPVIKTILNTIWFLVAFFKGLGELRGFKPDLIHAHILTRHAFLAWYCSRRFGVPFVISEHWSRYFPGSGFHFNRIHRWFTRQMVLQSSALLPVSESLKKAMEDLGIRHTRTIVQGNTVDISRFIPDTGNTSATAIVRILHVSCFDNSSKNITGLLRVMQKISHARNDFQLILAGEGPDFQSLQEYAEKLGLAENFVMFAGLLTEDKMVEAYQNAGFLVQSSLYETFGTVVPEAMACGKPVVSTATGVATWLVGKGTGILVPPGDETALEIAINRMIQSYQDYDPRLIRQRVLDYCSPAAAVEGITRVYNMVLG